MTDNKPNPKLPQEGGSYVVDKRGNPVLRERTIQPHEAEHPGNAPAAAPLETPLKDA